MIGTDGRGAASCTPRTRRQTRDRRERRARGRDHRHKASLYTHTWHPQRTRVLSRRASGSRLGVAAPQSLWGMGGRNARNPERRTHRMGHGGKWDPDPSLYCIFLNSSGKPVFSTVTLTVSLVYSLSVSNTHANQNNRTDNSTLVYSK